jgi:hypothetical protein
VRRTPSVLLFSALAPSAAYLAGCFGASTPAATGDAGFPIEQQEGGVTFEAGLDASVVLSKATIDFGLADCGSSPPAKMYSIQNSGPVAVTWSATITAPFTITSPTLTAGTLEPGTTLPVLIGVSTILTTSPAGVPITGTLTVTTNVPGYNSVEVPLTVTPQGGSLTLTPSVVGFGEQQIGTTSSPPLSFTLKNVGNEAVTVAFGTPSDAEFAVSGAGSIAPGASLSGASATFTPASSGAKSGMAAIDVTGALCASTATSVSFSGTGTIAPINIGPSPLDFSTVSCGQAAAAQTVTIQNSGIAAITYTAALGLGASSPFTIAPSMGTIAAGMPGTITVTPNPIPVPGNITAGAYDDTLTVTTSAPGTTPFAIPLEESASGAILALTMASTAFGTVQNQTKTLPFTVTNTGNADADGLTLVVTGAGFGAVFTNGDVATAGGGTAPGNAAFTPTTNGNASGSVDVTTTTPLCSAPPQALDLTAIGAVPVITTSGSLALSTTCGSAGSQATLTLTNSGNAPATVTVSPSPGTVYTIVSEPASVPAGGQASIVVQGVQGPTGGATTSGTLTFTTNEPVNPTHTATVTNAISGANLSVTQPAALTDNSSCSATPVSFSVNNTGNMTASLTTSIPPVAYYACGETSSEYFYFTDDPFSTTGPTSLPPGSLAGSVEAGVCCTMAPGSTGSGSYSITATGPICSGANLTLNVSSNATACTNPPDCG